MPTHKNIMLSGKAIDGEAMTADLTSHWIDLEGASLVSIQIDTEDAAASFDHVGVVYFRLTNDLSRTPQAMTYPSFAIASGAANHHFAELADMSARFLEVFYDRTSGGSATQKLTATVHVKRTN